MVFGIQKLQNEVFCLKEERDFFQEKYLEQVSEIASLKDELKLARREITRLRGQLMSSETISNVDGIEPSSPTSKAIRLRHLQNESTNDDQCSTDSETCSNSTNSVRDEGVSSESDEEAEELDVRQSAEKLLQWASYRSSAYRSKSIQEESTPAPPSPTNIQNRNAKLKLGEDDEPESIECARELKNGI